MAWKFEEIDASEFFSDEGKVYYKKQEMNHWYQQSTKIIAWVWSIIFSILIYAAAIVFCRGLLSFHVSMAIVVMIIAFGFGGSFYCGFYFGFTYGPRIHKDGLMRALKRDFGDNQEAEQMFFSKMYR